MTTEKSKCNNKLYYIHSAITLLLMFGFQFIPPVEPLTLLGMQVLGIFLGLLYAWTFVDFTWPSLMGMVALGLTGYAPMTTIFAQGFGADLAILVFFSFVLSSYLSKVGLTQIIANWFISRPINIGRPWVLALMIFLSAYFLGAVMSLTATIIIIWSIYYKLCDAIGLKPREKYPVLVLLGIAYSAMLGYTIFPFKPMAALVLNIVTESTGLVVDSFQFISCMMIFSLICLVVYVLICKYIFRPDTGILKNDTDHFAELRGAILNKEQKVASFVTIGFIVVAVLPSILPNWPWVGVLKSLGMTGALVTALSVGIFLRLKSGEPMLDFNKVANRDISWDIVIMLVATTPISKALNSPESGVMTFIVGHLEPVVAHLSPTLFVLVFVAFCAILTQFAHNLVAAAVMTPIMCQFALALGADPILIGMMMAFVLNVGIATPGGSTPGALAYANRHWISAGQAYGYNFIIFTVNLFLVLTVGLFLMQLMIG